MSKVPWCPLDTPDDWYEGCWSFIHGLVEKEQDCDNCRIKKDGYEETCTLSDGL